MRKFSVLLALLALLFTDLALAAGALVTSLTGSATVQAGTAPARVLRQGDEVKQGETITTGPASAAVLKFDDGQIAALTANSKMTVSAYSYNPQNESGNVFLSLLSGGMRTITGLIGRRSPNNVAYRAATATVGIRGTDNVILTDGTDVVVSVTEGSVTVRIGDQVLVVDAGQAVFTRPGQAPIRGSIAQVLAGLPSTFAGELTQAAALSGAIAQALGSTGNQGQGNQDQGNQQTGSNGGAQGSGGAGSGGAGGGGNSGTASGS